MYDFKCYGLLYKPDLKELNNQDFVMDWIRTNKYKVPTEFSVGDQRVLENAIKILGDKCRVILEIGVNNFFGSSTQTILRQKPKESKYLGIDIDDTKLSSLIDEANGVYGLLVDSGNYEKVVSYMKEIGIEQFDFIHIDGNHSVNQVLKDWKYTDFLTRHGCVVMHDTNIHPGPTELIKAIDPAVWKVERHYSEQKDDWGITVFWKI